MDHSQPPSHAESLVIGNGCWPMEAGNLVERLLVSELCNHSL